VGEPIPRLPPLQQFQPLKLLLIYRYKGGGLFGPHRLGKLLEPVYDLYPGDVGRLQRVICNRSCWTVIKKDDAEKILSKRHQSRAV
jgi:hypothetical protein